MMPKTSVSPAAMRKSITPYCRPLSVCSSTRARVMDTLARGPLPLHRTLAGVGILVALENGPLDLHHQLSARILHGLQQVEVLDREVVHVVLVRPAHRRVLDLVQRRVY